MNNELVVKTVRSYDGIKHKASIIVFVPNERPFDNGDIIGDFAWRRTHEPYSKEEVLAAVRDTVVRMGHLIKKISYSRKAGCSMCPCSPGFLIYTDQEIHYTRQERTAIWLKYNKE